jgi:hypothetical protein
MKNQFRIQVKETGDHMDYFDTLKEAQSKIKEWEKEDKYMGVYSPDFYEIAELTLDGTYTPVES